MNSPVNTSTSTHAYTQIPTDNLPPWSQEGLGGGIPYIVFPAAVFYIGRLLLRRFMKDRTEIVKDRAETDIIQVLREDNTKLRDELYRVQKERNDSASELGRFVAESELYKLKVEELKTSICELSAKLEEQTKVLQAVLSENAQLKSQVQHLALINDRLEKEVTNLDSIVNKMVALNEKQA